MTGLSMTARPACVDCGTPTTGRGINARHGQPRCPKCAHTHHYRNSQATYTRILELRQAGYLNVEIAYLVGLTPSAVRMRLTNLRRKGIPLNAAEGRR